MYTEREFSKTNVLDLSFLFIFLLRYINSNKFELIHPWKNIKNTLTLSNNVRLKMTRVLCILISRVINWEREFYFKNYELMKTFCYYYLYLRKCYIILQSFKSFQLKTFLFILNSSISFSNFSWYTVKAIYNWKSVNCHSVTSNWNAGCSGYLDNFNILSILTLTFNCGFPCALGLAPKTPHM